jgi:predicted O-methyltransferase YrrM
MELVRAVGKLLSGKRPIFIDYPPSPRPRWGHGRQAHPQLFAWLERGRDAYRDRLLEIVGLRASLQRIPARGTPDSGDPYWINDFLPGLDAAALYTFVVRRAPRAYVEIGSGHSTRFAARAIRDHRLAAKITTIDPAPRASLGPLTSRNIRLPLQDIEPDAIASLVQPGDILFFDGSHRALQNSDVTAFFLEVLPRLQAGVLVQIHDICLPYDYAPEWEDRWYSEQYLLAAYILGGASRMRVVLPNAFVSADAELLRVTRPLWDGAGLEAVARGGSSFWFETVDP